MQLIKLSNFTQGRDNNFNLIRILAALAVLITHGFALAIGTSDAEPFRVRLGMTMGTIAVDIFFITSGFLVTSSLLNRQSAIEFIWARVLRVFPALFVMLFLTVFGLGVFFTSLPIPTYLADSNTYIYLFKCATLITGVAHNLPGVFNSNPYKDEINGSLWTMTYEVGMYTILTVVWVALRLLNRSNSKPFKIAIVATFIGVLVLVNQLYPFIGRHFIRLFFMFFSGAAFYLYKEHVTLSRSLFCLFVMALLLSFAINKHVFFVVYALTIAYILFYVAYVPSGIIRKYIQVGDYSYGIYIYAFPVQQSIAALIPEVSVSSMLVISVSVTFLLAALSWHFLEQRALSLKNLYVTHTRKILSHCLTSALDRKY